MKFDFLIDNLGTVAVALLLAFVIGAVLYKTLKSDSRDRCGCGCSSCPMKDSCHSNDRNSANGEEK